jgi:hypothetical protein
MGVFVKQFFSKNRLKNRAPGGCISGFTVYFTLTRCLFTWHNCFFHANNKLVSASILSSSLHFFGGIGLMDFEKITQIFFIIFTFYQA